MVNYLYPIELDISEVEYLDALLKTSKHFSVSHRTLNETPQTIMIRYCVYNQGFSDFMAIFVFKIIPDFEK